MRAGSGRRPPGGGRPKCARTRPRVRFRAGAVWAIGWAFLAPGSLVAQTWVVEAHGGRLQHDATPAADPSAALVSLGLVGLTGRVAASAGVPLREGDPLWGGVSVWKRLAMRSGAFSLGLELSADGLVREDRGSAGFPVGGGLGDGLLGHRPLPTGEPLSGWSLTAAAMPLVGLAWGAFGLEASAGMAAHGSEFGGARLERTLPGADVRFAWMPAPGRTLSITGRQVRAEEGRWSRAGASAAGTFGALTVHAEGGHWLGEGGPRGTEWRVAGRVALSDALALVLSGRRAAVDPLRLTPAHTSWSAGISWTFGGPPRAAAPVPAAYAEGRAVIAVDEDGAGPSPRIAGDFNDWTPAPMDRVGDEWRLTVALDPGVYYWALVAPDGTWFVPPSVPGRRDDGFGGEVAVLVVEETK